MPRESDARPRTAESVAEAIGQTPLVQLRRIVPADSARILVKLEYMNPTGSMKDRMAKAVIEAAEADGRLQPGDTVIEYTGGSTGTSLALMCAAKGYRLRIVTSDAFSEEKRDNQAALGAEMTIVPSDRGRITEALIKEMIETARQYSLEAGTFWTDQLNNHDAVAGYEPLAEELWTQTQGRLDAFVHGVGTAHSSHGVVQTLRRHRSDLRFVAVEPAESPVLSEGRTGGHRIEGIGIGFLPPLWDPSLPNDIYRVESHEAHEMTRRLAREEGIFAGASSGANIVAALRVARELGPAATLVTLAADSGLKYLTTQVYKGLGT